MIPKEIYEKYHLADITEYETESVFYETFLIRTDFISNKILEGVATSEEYADELYYREVARQQINGGSVEAVNVTPLDASVERAGANIDYIAMMTDIELPTEG